MRVCSGAGCIRAISEDVRFCDECKPVVVAPSGEREHTVTDAVRYHALYAGSRWQKRVQPMALRRCPFCAMCNAAVSALVDHIVPSGIAIQQARDSGAFPLDANAGFYLLSNLQGLCRACHYIKTLADKVHVGPWPDVMAGERTAPKKRWSF